MQKHLFPNNIIKSKITVFAFSIICIGFIIAIIATSSNNPLLQGNSVKDSKNANQRLLPPKHPIIETPNEKKQVNCSFGLHNDYLGWTCYGKSSMLTNAIGPDYQQCDINGYNCSEVDDSTNSSGSGGGGGNTSGGGTGVRPF